MSVNKEFDICHLHPEGEEVVHRWPSIYLEPNSIVKNLIDGGVAEQKDLCNLRYGFEFPRHWIILADKFGQFASALVEELRESGVQPDAFIKAVIFKEKWNLLCWQGEDNLKQEYKNIMNRYLDFLMEESVHLKIREDDI